MTLDIDDLLLSQEMESAIQSILKKIKTKGEKFPLLMYKRKNTHI